MQLTMHSFENEKTPQDPDNVLKGDLQLSKKDLLNRNNVQYIERKIIIDKFKKNGAGEYYKRVKWSLSTKIDKDKETFIHFIPNKDIEDLYVLETLLMLQLEHTPNIICPSSTIERINLNDWVRFFNPRCMVELLD